MRKNDSYFSQFSQHIFGSLACTVIIIN